MTEKSPKKTREIASLNIEGYQCLTDVVAPFRTSKSHPLGLTYKQMMAMTRCNSTVSSVYGKGHRYYITHEEAARVVKMMTARKAEFDAVALAAAAPKVSTVPTPPVVDDIERAVGEITKGCAAASPSAARRQLDDANQAAIAPVMEIVNEIREAQIGAFVRESEMLLRLERMEKNLDALCKAWGVEAQAAVRSRPPLNS